MVTVSEKTRKIIWVEAGGRCAMCRRQVVTEGTETDDPSVFGEEVHIVARSGGGPRSGGLPDGQLDSHENLILLCSEHHKQIDDQPNHFTVERLRQMKQAHREWIAALGNNGTGPVRVVPDPTFPEPSVLKMIFTGSELFAMIRGSHELGYLVPDEIDGQDEDLAVEFIDTVKDYLDLAGDLQSARQIRDAERMLGSYVSQLAERGYVVGAFVRRMLLAGGIREEPLPWRVVNVEVQPAKGARLVDQDGGPFQSTEEDLSRLNARIAEEQERRARAAGS